MCHSRAFVCLVQWRKFQSGSLVETDDPTSDSTVIQANTIPVLDDHQRFVSTDSIPNSKYLYPESYRKRYSTFSSKSKLPRRSSPLMIDSFDYPLGGVTDSDPGATSAQTSP